MYPDLYPDLYRGGRLRVCAVDEGNSAVETALGLSNRHYYATGNHEPDKGTSLISVLQFANISVPFSVLTKVGH